MVARLATARTVDDGPLRFTSIFYFARPHCLINITRDSDTVTRPSVRLSQCYNSFAAPDYTVSAAVWPWTR